MRKIFRTFLIALTFVMFQISTLRAEVVLDATTGIFDSSSSDLDYAEIGKEIKSIEDYLKSGQLSTTSLNNYIKVIMELKNKLGDAKKNLDKELGFVQKRIEALGEVPPEGEVEIEAISKKRKAFNDEASYYKVQLAEVDVLLANINEVDSLMSNTRNREILGRLLDKQTSVLYPQTLFNDTKLFVSFVFDIISSPIGWYKNLNVEQKLYFQSNIIPVLLILILSFALGLYLRLLIMRNVGYKRSIEQPKYITKVTAAFFVAIAYGAIPATIVGGFILWLKNAEIMTIGFFGLVVNNLLFYFLYIFLLTAISRVIFAPYNGRWRLVDVSDEKAKKIKSALYLSIILIGIFSYFSKIAMMANYPISLISFISILSGASKLFAFLIVSKNLFWDDAIVSYRQYADREKNDDDEHFEQEEVQESPLERKSKITFVLSLVAIAFFSLSLVGYVKLSAFLLNRFLATLIFFGVLSILRKAIVEVLHRLLFMIFWTKNFKLRRRMIYKINFWLVLLLDIVIFVFTAILLLALWGVPQEIIILWLRKFFLGFNVGGVEVSIMAIVMGILVFFISLTVVRILKNKLMVNILEKMDIDDGIRHSLAGGFGFIGFILAALFSILVMGGNLTNLALVAGALSFGIGLGLQNIVNNFVSGIILLFERPVKVGDWVVVNNYEGIIKQINIRATELQLWNRSVVVIPNADFLATSVVNYTLHDKHGRIEVPLSVAYGTDVNKVTNILLDIAAKNKRVLKNPEPYVVFMGFGNTSLEFQLRCFTKDIMSRLTISSEMRYEINRIFAEEKIQLAIPQIVYRSGHQLNLDEMIEGENNNPPKNRNKILDN
ncbi:MAG: mechanosensitive ion channel [Alphaproteobacteria bacterium]|nr:mechanosensitive ion channel [Alphaproteobacteria bacterium]